MAEETLKIKVVVDNQASSAINNIKQQFNNTKQTTDIASKSISKVTRSLNTLNGINLIGLGKQIKDSSVKFEYIRRACKTTSVALDRFKKHYNNIFENFKINKNVWNFAGKFDDRISPNESIVGKWNNIKYLIKGTSAELKKLNRDLVRIAKVTLPAAWNNLKENLNNLNNYLNNFYKKIGTIFKALLAIGSVKWIKDSIQVAANADEVADNAQKVFMSTAAYQEWGYALEQNGINISQLNTVMRTFGKNVTTNTSLMKKYGIGTKSVSGAFDQAVKKIQSMKTESEKLTAATELFGNRAAQLMPILNSDAGTIQALMDTYRIIGGTMSDQLISKGDVLTDSIVEMKAAWQGLKNTLATGLIPIITTVVQGLSYAIGKVRLLIKAIFGIQETFSGASNNASDLSTNIDAAAGSAGKLKRILMGYDELNRLEGSDGSGGISGLVPDVEDFESIGNLVNNSKLLEKLKKYKLRLEDLNVGEAFAQARRKISEAWKEFKEDYETNGFSIKSFIKLVINVIKPIVDALDNVGIGDVIRKALIAGFAIFAATGSVGSALTATIVSGIILSIISLTADNKTKETVETIGNMLIGLLPIAVGALTFLKTGNIWAAVLSALLTLAITKIGANNKTGVTVDSLSNMLVNLLPIAVGVLTFIRTGDIWTAVLAAAITLAMSKISLDNKTGETVTGFVGKVGNMLLMAGLGGILGGIAGLILGGPQGAMLGFKIGATLTLIFETIETNYDKVKGELEAAGTIKVGNNGPNGNPVTITTPTGTANTNYYNGVGATETLNTLKKQGADVGTAIKAMLSAGYKSSALQLGLKKSNYGISDTDLTILKKRYGFAKGGVLKTPTFGLLAEYANAQNNPEVIAPQSVIEQTINASNGELANAFAQGVRQIVSAIESKDDSIIIGDETIARAAGKGNASHIKRTGVSLI